MTPPTNSLAPVVSTVDPEIAWKQLVALDPKARFVYGVTTTGVFCRPGCASRRPLRENVRFFQTVVEAQAAGFRACKRCGAAVTAPGAALHGADLWMRSVGILKKNLDRPRVRWQRTGSRCGAEPIYRAEAFQARDGREPVAIPARDASGQAARSVEERRECDRCNLRRRGSDHQAAPTKISLGMTSQARFIKRW